MRGVRTTLSLDEDVFILAKQMAKRERTSIGKAVSALIRETQGAVLPARQPKSPFTVYPSRGEVITTEHVYRLLG